jgi:phosphoglucomutase/phosphomannomutase
MEGSDGMKRMERLMSLLRESTPWSLGEINIKSMRDYDALTRRYQDGSVEAFDGPQGNLIFLETDVDGNYVAIRPSGTEPKIKLYMFGYCSPEDRRDLEEIKAEVHNRLDIFEKELRAFADSVQ